MRGIHWLQCPRYTIKADVRADPAFESTPCEDVAYSTDSEREDRIREVGRWPVDDGIRLEQRRLHIERFETAIDRVHVDMTRPLDEQRILRAVVRIVAAVRGGHR